MKEDGSDARRVFGLSLSVSSGGVSVVEYDEDPDIHGRVVVGLAWELKNPLADPNFGLCEGGFCGSTIGKRRRR